MPPVDKHRVTIGPNNTVNVHLPGDVLFSLERLTTVQRTILGRLGCQACCSGFIINYTIDEQQFAH